MSFSITRRYSLREKILGDSVALHHFEKFHASDFVITLTIKAAEARNQGSEYAASDGTMFTFGF